MSSADVAAAPQVPAGLSNASKGAAAAGDCLKIIMRVPEIDSFSADGAAPPQVTGRIDVRDVYFAYPSAPDFLICNGYSLVVHAGQQCALSGPSGSGKSTIINLLQRFYDPQVSDWCEYRWLV